jgi:hypothetical protein
MARTLEPKEKLSFDNQSFKLIVLIFFLSSFEAEATRASTAAFE